MCVAHNFNSRRQYFHFELAWRSFVCLFDAHLSWIYILVRLLGKQKTIKDDTLIRNRLIKESFQDLLYTRGLSKNYVFSAEELSKNQ